jgi:chromosome segregation ATPase
MRRHLIALTLVLAAVLPTAQARAQSEADKLRDALRSLTVQNRALEDERAVLQSRLAQSDQEKERLRREVDADKAEIRRLQREQREAIEQFNQRLGERDETLGKWKTAYEEAATVARTKDAERQKAATEAATFKASTKACQGKNTQLVKVGRELLGKYEHVTLGTAFVAGEPLTGLGRAEIQNLLQDYGDKILEQKATP